MVLTKNEILRLIKNKSIGFSPMIDGFQLQPHAVDLRLGNEFFIPRMWNLTKNGREAIIIDPLDNANIESFENIKLKYGQYFELLPGEFVIANTMEKISLKSSEVMAVLYPRSSVNRRGLAVDLSGIIDTGYIGKLMIPIINNTSKQVIKIYPGERICQVVFQRLESKLSSDEASMHGLAKAKYTKTRKGFAGGKNDKSKEIKLIKEGKIKELKRKYTIS